MLYIGMEAMSMAAIIEYQPDMVVLSVCIVISVSVVALWLLGREKHRQSVSNISYLIIASIGMGLAISGMLYIGMAAANFIPVTNAPHLEGTSYDATGLVSGGGIIVSIILLAVIGFSARKKRLGTSISSRVTLLAFSMVVVSALTIGTLFYQHTAVILIDRDLAKLSQEVEVEASELLSIVDTLRQDVLFLSNTPPIGGITRSFQHDGVDPIDGSTAEDWRLRFGAILESFLKSKKNYLQASFFSLRDDMGELVRVQRISDEITHIQTEQLLNEEDIQYPARVTLLKPGQVYLSDVRLARELNEIIEPHQSIMQAAVPIFTVDIPVIFENA